MVRAARMGGGAPRPAALLLWTLAAVLLLEASLGGKRPGVGGRPAGKNRNPKRKKKSQRVAKPPGFDCEVPEWAPPKPEETAEIDLGAPPLDPLRLVPPPPALIPGAPRRLLRLRPAGRAADGRGVPCQVLAAAPRHHPQLHRPLARLRQVAQAIPLGGVRRARGRHFRLRQLHGLARQVGAYEAGGLGARQALHPDHPLLRRPDAPGVRL